MVEGSFRSVGSKCDSELMEGSSGRETRREQTEDGTGWSRCEETAGIRGEAEGKTGNCTMCDIYERWRTGSMGRRDGYRHASHPVRQMDVVGELGRRF
jgi:hypothetical protein